MIVLLAIGNLPQDTELNREEQNELAKLKYAISK